ncbi:hypothetical protein E4T80_11550 [Muribacter muris]|uniref:Antirepressor protein ant N-terminal domain-containing protein n=1 Tax=Muribacter muris TaxID=67855 RepID=A0A4Y9JRL8_9PAST|nr:hypothetical protein [Muribacter muris]TFV07982.1 hypothetical protein E4T80_11550 [Muribacter muris]
MKRDEVLNQGVLIIRTPTNGGEQQMLCLPIDYLNGWLFGIDVKRVKPEIRETLIMYKKECYKALADYWFKGKAERSQNPRPNLPLAEEPKLDIVISYEQAVWIAKYLTRAKAFAKEVEVCHRQLFKSLGLPRYQRNDLAAKGYDLAHEFNHIIDPFIHKVIPQTLLSKKKQVAGF